ncbi:MAG: hypothetical protein CYPHOPRED_002017 [Cyphobasidiales sp. Tagirdzhanova-0007]|nr:MAG: hypothetical protein CYPHOPRED_002017 [Cyphobasidiales sp. Tagirdzhanova-0007]
MGGIGGAPDTMNVNIADAAASKMHASGMPTVGQAVEDEGGFDKPYKGSGEGATGKASSMTSGSGIESQGIESMTSKSAAPGSADESLVRDIENRAAADE